MSQAGIWLLDIGNSRGKWLYIDGAGGANSGHFSADDLPEPIRNQSSSEQVLIASVASSERDGDLSDRLTARARQPWFARTRSQVPGLFNSYEEPERMGVDRWLAMLAGSRRASGPFCVVDAGSALTIDLVDEHGRHEGGYILAGRALQEQALLGQTDRVRFAENVEHSLRPGRSTAEAVIHGVTLAMVGAVRTVLDGRSTPSRDLFLCGGDADLLHKHLERDSERVDHLVFEGLVIQAELEGELESSALLLDVLRSPKTITPRND